MPHRYFCADCANPISKEATRCRRCSAEHRSRSGAGRCPDLRGHAADRALSFGSPEHHAGGEDDVPPVADLVALD